MRKEPNYIYLTISLLVAIVMTTAAPPLGPVSVAGIFLAAGSLIMAARVITRFRHELLLVITLGGAAMLPFAIFSVYGGPLFPHLAKYMYVLNLVLWMLLTFSIGLMVFRGILTAHRIRRNEIYGAIYLYLLLGVLFAQTFQLVLAAQPNALHFAPGRFAEPVKIADGLLIPSPGDVLYYSFVTLGTVGFGDVTPATPLARALSLAEVVIGIMYVATMIARLVSVQITAEHQGRVSDKVEDGLIPPGAKPIEVKRRSDQPLETIPDPASIRSFERTPE